MDPVATEHSKQALSNQGALLGQHDSALNLVMDNLQQLVTSVAQLGRRMDSISAQLTNLKTPADPPPPPPAVEIAAKPPAMLQEPYIPTPASSQGYNATPLTPHLSTTKFDSSPPASAGPKKPMQLGRAKLTPEERQQRLDNHLCIYCAGKGHYLAQCPAVPKGQAHQQAGGGAGEPKLLNLSSHQLHQS
ncbi:hypothetical protein D5F01_LYC06661 [Xyrichtys novacula]|uniref:CCHC-type domain-containing protein n=1 Tax=Xyrichtys novacula TaxID=13765 RepID=A0AAV1F3R0_XYRNO|nr:hypothetical protein D5F01_LYC06661 [Xyrichtys novacula]